MNDYVKTFENSYALDKVDFGHFPKKLKTPVFGRRKLHKNKN